MKEIIFGTTANWAGFILRLTLGLILFPHGSQKMLGWFGGYGFSGTMSYFTETRHLPWLIGFLVIVIEFFGSIFLITGFASRIWAIAIIILFIGIIFSSHIMNGFFMNWYGNLNGEGYEFHLLMIGLALAIATNGSGKFSVDGLIVK